MSVEEKVEEKYYRPILQDLKIGEELIGDLIVTAIDHRSKIYGAAAFTLTYSFFYLLTKDPVLSSLAGAPICGLTHWIHKWLIADDDFNEYTFRMKMD